MTVAELIKTLQDLAIAHDASEVPVRFNDGEYGDTDISTVTLEMMEPNRLVPNRPPVRPHYVLVSA